MLVTVGDNTELYECGGGGTEERTLMNSQTQSSAFDGGQIWGQMGGAND